MNIILYRLDKPEEKVVAAKAETMAEARRLMKLLAGKGWQMDRRPDIHTFGDLIMRAEQEGKRS